MPRDRKSLEDHKLQNTKPQWTLPDSDVAASRPSFPKNISQTAKKKFKQLVCMLEQRRTVTAGDQEILRLYVVLFDRHERALGRLQTEGDIVDCETVSKTGEVYTVQKVNPSLKIAEVCEQKMAKTDGKHVPEEQYRYPIMGTPREGNEKEGLLNFLPTPGDGQPLDPKFYKWK